MYRQILSLCLILAKIYLFKNIFEKKSAVSSVFQRLKGAGVNDFSLDSAT